jgi:superfamily I DNA/RNA helicase
MVFGDRPDPRGNFAVLRLLENLRNSQQIAKPIDNFNERPAIARGPHAFDVEYVLVSEDEKVFDIADDQVANLTDVEQWELKEIALLTTERRHEEHKLRAEGDRMAHWDSLWNEDSVFYCSVSGFKGLERPVVVLAVDGFHPGVDPKDVLYVGMSRARDKLIVVARQKEMDLIHSIQNSEK